MYFDTNAPNMQAIYMGAEGYGMEYMQEFPFDMHEMATQFSQDGMYDPSFTLYMQQGWIAAGFDELGAAQIPGGVVVSDGSLMPESGSKAVAASTDASQSVEADVTAVACEAYAAETKVSEKEERQRRRRGDKDERVIKPCRDEDQRRAENQYTTVMLRNIPNKYTREMLVEQLDRNYRTKYDFLYLPIDFKNKCNVGYGFINFRTPAACEDFIKQFHGVDVRKCLPGLKSNKVVEVTPARVQGLMENIRRLRNSPVMNQLLDHPEWMPMVFTEHGGEEDFPKPDQPLPPVKPRGRGQAPHSGR
jgi:hypothetical protein